MENVIFEIQDVTEVLCEPAERDVRDLNDLHLALVGGGTGEVVPF